MSSGVQIAPAPSKPAPSTGLPAIVLFDYDPAAIAAVNGIKHYLRVKFSQFTPDRQEEAVVITSYEQMIADNESVLRSPNVRVIALSNERFSNPRTDGLVYAYLPPDTSAAILERLIDNAVDHIHLLSSRRGVTDKLAGAQREIEDLNLIGASLSAEHDRAKLLELILTKTRELTRSDAGSLYLIEEQPAEGHLAEAPPDDTIEVAPGVKLASAPREQTRRVLRFKIAQNDSVNVQLRELTLLIDDTSVAGYVALTGETINISDAYNLPAGLPYQINRKFDDDFGYRTKSILAVPMRNPRGETVGVLQLINAKRHAGTKLDSLETTESEVMSYSLRQQDLLVSLASQAAVAVENTRLYDSIQRLFEGFVTASVSAIEARDPSTYGHSFRVANMTVALADAVDRIPSGPYGSVRFTQDQVREIRYASLLHDFGKVGVREAVLVKAKKLYPYQMELIRRRFEFAKRTLETDALREQLRLLLQVGRDEYQKQLPEIQARIARDFESLESEFTIVTACNEPNVVPDGDFERLGEIAKRSVPDTDGSQISLLTGEEVRLLSIRQGSLDEDERLQIEAHVEHSFRFLSQIPWTQEIRNVAHIARGHHEKLNGKGYPHNLAGPQIPLQTRMMTISDIYDALAAGDRPYKKGVNSDRALDIMSASVKDGELDAHLFSLFLEAKVYEKRNEEA